MNSARLAGSQAGRQAGCWLGGWLEDRALREGVRSVCVNGERVIERRGTERGRKEEGISSSPPKDRGEES